MDRTYTVTGIVLRQYPLKEADKILVLLTREHGLKRVVAKGLRKASSRIGGRLEPLVENTVQLAKGRNMDLVTQVEGLTRFAALTDDFDRLAAAMGAAELMGAFLADDDPQPEAYDLFLAFLGQLLPGVSPALVLVAFELQLLELLGYRPELETCMACDREITDGHEAHGLSIEAGGVVCTHCEGLLSGRVRRLGPDGWQLLATLQHVPLDACALVDAAPTALARCRHALNEYLSFRAERELKAQGMLEWLPTPTVS